MSSRAATYDTEFECFSSIVGPDHVLTDTESCIFYSQDVFTKDIPALAVILPGDKYQLAEIVRVAVDKGYDVIPRGGGMSYTSGYVPATNSSVIVDLGRMNKVLEINEEDMFVTVECGCTWSQLHDALKLTGLRTPFWGSLSGLMATVGGGLSQNAIFWGSGQFGTVADSLLGLEVVLSDGSIVKTGSGAQVNGSPFFRHFGPDLNGLFTSDAGAFGFKANATLRLIPQFESKSFLAFDFKNASDIIAAMSEIGRLGLAMECFGFDPCLQKQRMKRESLAKDVKSLAAVMRESGSLTGAIADGAQLAMAGRSFMENVDFSLQIMIEDRIDAATKARSSEVREICMRQNGKEIENSIPKLLRANPFNPLNNMLGPAGERWVPIHAILPHSKVQDAYKGIDEIVAKHQALIEKHEILVGHLFALIANNGFVLEPVFFWPDEIAEIHQYAVEKDHLARLKRFPKNQEAREAVEILRKEMLELFGEFGAIHMQIGKSYNYRMGIEPSTRSLVESLKNAIDPLHKVNPNSLGLD